MENKEPLTSEEIIALPEILRPGYVGEDEVGLYKIDAYGDKKRPFERGGPSPNSKGRPKVCDSKDPQELMDHHNWISPLEFFMAVMNCDVKTLNRTRKSNSQKVTQNDIKFRDQMDAASKALKYFVEPAGKGGKEVIDGVDEGSGQTGHAVLQLDSPGRRSLIQND